MEINYLLAKCDGNATVGDDENKSVYFSFGMSYNFGS